jgi:hypothetical protein
MAHLIVQILMLSKTVHVNKTNVTYNIYSTKLNGKFLQNRQAHGGQLETQQHVKNIQWRRNIIQK